MKIFNCFKFVIIFIFIFLNVCSFLFLGIVDEFFLRQRWDFLIFRKNDEVGLVNWINNKKVLEFLKLVKKVKVVILGKVYQ